VEGVSGSITTLVMPNHCSYVVRPLLEAVQVLPASVDLKIPALGVPA
jgi:hypothetical protein